ncbi:TIGR03435 family protein [Terriglobus albidus]|uniref:TIGR03435 family protein n=1 Tax=Terriglobus albidus TaxID=1592106 RepID=A0A5B9EF74_9BACT|nr:TIGR03435 family protein [Terriglobus albidus]QEE30712.1 TIGR03435 family protein [Terriglobus albidus]
MRSKLSIFAASLAFCLQATFGQSAEVPPTFEVATIKLNNPDMKVPGMTQGVAPSERRVFARDSLVSLVRWAYGLQKNEQVQAHERWMADERFELDARVGEPTASSMASLSQEERLAKLRLMMRTLLHERFGLEVRQQEQEQRVIALMVTKGGLKLKSPGEMGEHTLRGIWSSPGRADATNATMKDLADLLVNLPEADGLPVVDRTGFQGEFAMSLRYVPVSVQSEGPTLFTALEEQLGVKLVRARDVVGTVVIDAAHRPSEN